MHDVTTSSLSFAELKKLHLAHAEKIYRRRNGDPTREHLNVAAALNRFEIYAGAASDPAKINRHQVRAWLDQLAAEELSRSYVNSCLSRLRRFVRWSADLEYIPLQVDHELRLVQPLKPCRSRATESVPRPEVPFAQFDQIAQFLPTWARDVVQLLKLTGARPGEIIELTNAEVHLDHAPRLTPLQHKTAHHGKQRVIPLCPKAVAIVERYHRPFCPADRLFTSQKSLALCTNSLTTAWDRARKKANAGKVQAYDVRRSVARKVRRTKGLDAAQALLGHSNARTTEIYAPLDAGDAEAFKLAAKATEVLH